MHPAPPERVRFGIFEADLRSRELFKQGRKVRLHQQAFQTLALLLEHPGELVTRDELHRRLWPSDTFVNFDLGLNSAVKKLRDALSDSADSPRYVETLPRRGYRFIAAVTRSSPVTAVVGASETSKATESVPPPVEIDDIPPFAQVEKEDHPAKGRNRRRFYLITAAVVAGFFLFPTMVWFVVRLVMVAGARDGHSPGQHIRPLTNLNAETSEPAFSPDGNYIAFRAEGTKPGEGGLLAKAVGGDQPVPLTKNAGDCCPAWSPDGQTIAFARFEEKEFQIYTASLSHESGGGVT